MPDEALAFDTPTLTTRQVKDALMGKTEEADRG